MDESSDQTTETLPGEFSDHSQVLTASLDELAQASDPYESEHIEALETELARSQASFTKLDDEFKAKVDDLSKLQKKYDDFEGEVSVKISDNEAKWNDRCNALRMNNVGMESKVASLEQELTAAKVSSEEWSKKAGELEGAVKALEDHQSRVEKESNESLAREVSAGMEMEKEANGLKEKLDQCLADLEGLRNTRSVLNDGSSMTTLYVKYQEASDALRLEQWERKHSQAVLDRVLREMEQKAGLILEEREKHERVLESYSEIEKKLKNSVSVQTELQRVIQELKAEMRRKDRETDVARREVSDLQNQVALLLKECQDINLHRTNASDPRKSFKDIRGLMEENVELKRRVDSLSEDILSQEKSWKEKYERDLQESAENAVANFNLLVAREKEQKQMIESLHTSVATYKKLYEELLKHQSSTSLSEEPMTKKRKLNVPNVVDNSREIFQKAHEKALERVRHLEELSKSVSETASMKSEGEKFALEARLSQEKLERFMKEFEHQKDQYNSSKERNDQYSQMIIDYQGKMRKNSELMNSALESSHKLTMEVSRLKQEKEIALSSEKRAYDEVHSLSERVSRLQASLDTIQSTEQVREEARSAEKREHELRFQETERKSADAIKEHENGMKSVLQKAEEAEKALSRVSSDLAAAEVRASTAEEKLKCLQSEVSDNNGTLAKEEAFKKLEATYEKSKTEAEAVKKSLEADVLSLRETIEELQGKLDMKSNDAGKEEITALQAQITSLKDDLERRVRLQSDANQELNKVSLNLAAVQEEASVLRNENSELKAKWEAEKTMLEVLKTGADKKYDEVNELNKVLVREKDELISKQNRLLSDVAGEKPLKEKVEEKNARIQILEKTVERLKDKLKKQKDELEMEKERQAKLEKPNETVSQQQPEKSKVDDGPKPMPSDNIETQGNHCLKRPSFTSAEEKAEPPVKKPKLSELIEIQPEVIHGVDDQALKQAATEETGKLIDINVEFENKSSERAIGSPSETNVSSLPRRGRGRPPGGRARGRGRGRVSQG